MNRSSKIPRFILYYSLFCLLLPLGACSVPTPVTIDATSTTTASFSTTPAGLAIEPAQTISPTLEPVNTLIPLQTFGDANTSMFCQTSVDLTKTNGLTYSCSEGKFSFLTAEGASDSDKFLEVAAPIQSTNTFIIEVDLTSIQGGKSDQNQYGFILGIDPAHSYTLRFKGLYYRLEQNMILFNQDFPQGENHITKRWNWNYSPTFLASGQTNHVKFACERGNCSLYTNDNLAAKFKIDDQAHFSSIALFAQTDYYVPFGSVAVDNFQVYSPSQSESTGEKFNIKDDLLSDKGSIQQSGLSGAYHLYKPDGYHFSSVIPFGIYGVKIGPVLEDSSISITVILNNDNPQSSMYSGLACRSSVEGMYLAVIRENGFFSVFRDTPNRPFTLLAEAKSDNILTDGAPNQLRLDCVGTSIAFYINGQQVSKLNDSQFNVVSGRSGFFTKAGKTPDPDRIIFSYLEINEVR